MIVYIITRTFLQSLQSLANSYPFPYQFFNLVTNNIASRICKFLQVLTYPTGCSNNYQLSTVSSSNYHAALAITRPFIPNKIQFRTTTLCRNFHETLPRNRHSSCQKHSKRTASRVHGVVTMRYGIYISALHRYEIPHEH